jgi:hypothetical protein
MSHRNKLLYRNILDAEIGVAAPTKPGLGTSVVHPDADGSGIICKLGSESVINSRSGCGSKLSFVSNQQIQSCKNVHILNKLAFLQCLDDLQFK